MTVLLNSCLQRSAMGSQKIVSSSAMGAYLAFSIESKGTGSSSFQNKRTFDSWLHIKGESLIPLHLPIRIELIKHEC